MLKRWWLGLVLLSSSAAFAQKPDAEGFETLKPGESAQLAGESIPASRLVAGAYGFIFASVLLYVVFIARRAPKNDTELRELEQKLNAKRT